MQWAKLWTLLTGTRLSQTEAHQAPTVTYAQSQETSTVTQVKQGSLCKCAAVRHNQASCVTLPRLPDSSNIMVVEVLSLTCCPISHVQSHFQGHNVSEVCRNSTAYLGLPSAKVWVSILVMPHQRTFFHIKIAAVCRLCIHLHTQQQHAVSANATIHRTWYGDMLALQTFQTQITT